jgi:hypothetical protein
MCQFRIAWALMLVVLTLESDRERSAALAASALWSDEGGGESVPLSEAVVCCETLSPSRLGWARMLARPHTHTPARTRAHTRTHAFTIFAHARILSLAQTQTMTRRLTHPVTQNGIALGRGAGAVTVPDTHRRRGHGGGHSALRERAPGITLKRMLLLACYSGGACAWV